MLRSMFAVSGCRICQVVCVSSVLVLAACSQSADVTGKAGAEQPAPDSTQAGSTKEDGTMTKSDDKVAPAVQDAALQMPVSTMRVPSTEVAAGESVEIEFSVENRSSADVSLLLWGSPLEDNLTAAAFKVVHKGSEGATTDIPYLGRMIKRRAPTDEDLVVLPAGETLSNTVALDKSYDLSKPGTYDIAFAPLSLSDKNTFTLGDTEVYVLDTAVTIIRLP